MKRLLAVLLFVTTPVTAQEIDLTQLFKEFHTNWQYVAEFNYYGTESKGLTFQYKGGIKYNVTDSVRMSFIFNTSRQLLGADFSTSYNAEIAYLF